MRKPKPEAPADLWEQLDKLLPDLTHKDDPGFSKEDFAVRYKIDRRNASRRVDRLVAEGKLLVGIRRNPINGNKVKVYRPA